MLDEKLADCNDEAGSPTHCQPYLTFNAYFDCLSHIACDHICNKITYLAFFLLVYKKFCTIYKNAEAGYLD